MVAYLAAVGLILPVVMSRATRLPLPWAMPTSVAAWSRVSSGESWQQTCHLLNQSRELWKRVSMKGLPRLKRHVRVRW